jgi:hypothetical protein
MRRSNLSSTQRAIASLGGARNDSFTGFCYSALILFSASSDRYSKIKFDARIDVMLL